MIKPSALIATSASRLDSIIERADSMTAFTGDMTGNTVSSLRTRRVSKGSTSKPALILARMALISPVRSPGLSRSMDVPSISSLEYPFILSTAGFQLVTMPSSVLAMMASFEFSTIAARSLEFSIASLCLFTSRWAVSTNRMSPVSRCDKLMLTGSSAPSFSLPLSCRSSPLDRLRGSAK